MKKYLLLLVLLTSVGFSQTWQTQSSGTVNHLLSVYFTDANTGTAVGMSGTILRTTNAGATWSAQVSGTAHDLRSVFFTNANTGTVVGGNGASIILRTTDGGSNWSTQTSPTAVDLYGVYFTDANNGAAVGDAGTILTTTNAGANWTAQAVAPFDHLIGITFSAANYGIVAGYSGVLLKTTDGGASWSALTSGTFTDLYKAVHTDLNCWTAVGFNGTILRTTDDGANWSAQASGTSEQLRSIAFSDANNGKIVGLNGIILVTTDAGANWVPQTSGTVKSLLAVSSFGSIVGLDGTILRYNSDPVANAATSITSTSFSANWSALTGVTGYKLDVATDNLFTFLVTGYNDLDVGNVTTYSVNTNLTPGTNYYYRVRAYAGGAAGNNSNIISLNTILTVPTAAAAGTITTTSFTSSWSPVTGASGYYLDVATDNLFASMVTGYNGVDVGNVISVSVNTNLTAGTDYWYRVRAYNAVTTSLSSSYVTLITLPGAVTASAATSIATTNFSANWNAQTGASGYRLDVAKDNLFTQPVTGYNNLDVSNVTTYSVNTNLTSGTHYYYRLRAYNASGTGSNSGTVSLITITAAPTASAATSVSTTSFSANWSAATGADGYRLDVATDNLFSTFVSGYQDVDVSNVVTYSVNSNLTSGTSYYYRVRAYNNSGTSTNSGTISLITAPDAPVIALASSITTTSFSANWSASVGAAGYRLDVSTSNTFNTFVTGFHNLNVGNVVTYSANTNINPGIVYYYRVRAYNAGGTSINSSNASLITISSAPVALAGSGITRYAFNANWSAPTGAAGYYLDVAKDNAFTTYLPGLQNLDVSNVTTYNINSLVPGYPYYFRVRAYNASGTSVNSSTITVTTLPPSADLVITSSVTNSVPKNLDVLTYHFTVVNNGPDTGKAIVLQASMPRGFKYGSSSAVGSTYDPNTGVWNVGTLVMGSSVSLTFVDTTDYFNQAYDFRNFYEFNVFSKLDATLTGVNVGGKLAVGRDLTIIGSDIGGQLRTRPTVPDVVVAGRDLDFQSGTVHYGNVAYGNSTNLPVTQVVYPNGSLIHSSPINFAAQGAYLNSLSSSLRGYDVNGVNTVTADTLHLTGTDLYLNVFTVTGAQLLAAPKISVRVPNGSVAVVNISGVSLEYTGSVDLNNNLDNFVLFNFWQATSLSIIGSSIDGTILAPRADLQATGSLFRGQLFVNSLNSVSAHQNHSFVGYIPLNRTIDFMPFVSSSFSTDPNGSNDVNNSTVVVNTTAPYGTAGNGVWSVASVLPVNEMVLSLTRLNATTILAGTNLGKIYTMDNNGVLGNVINSSMTPVAYIHQIAVSDSGHIFAATETGLYRSNDGGATWTTFLEGKEVRAILFGSSGYIYAGTWAFGVFRSNDFGYTWTAKNDNLTNTVIHALIDRTKNAPQYTVFAGTFGKGVSATYDYASTWMEMPTPSDFVTCMNKSSDGILYVGTLTDGVYRSYDNGNTFSHLTGLPDGPIYAIRVDSLNNIFVSSWLFGIYGSADLGQSWTYMGLGGYAVSTTFPGPNKKLFATSLGKLMVGNYSLTGVENDKNIIPQKFSLEQNYPNPFNPTTIIRYGIPAAERVTLKVFNILGKEMATLVNSELKVAGAYQVEFNASRLPSGVYFYRLEAGKNVSSKKLILIK